MSNNNGQNDIDISPEALTGSLRDYRAPAGKHLPGPRPAASTPGRTCAGKSALWPYAKSTSSAPRTHCEARNDDGQAIPGVNFASQDYLSLSSHPVVKDAAMEAIREYGVHSAGSAALLGNTRNSLLLEKAISEYIHGREVVLYPTGWSAGLPPSRALCAPMTMWSWMCWPIPACRKGALPLDAEHPFPWPISTSRA